MVSIGMIFQFDSTEGTGLIMLSGGEQKEFSTNEWVDDSNTPSVGLKVSYESSDGLIKIKVASETDKILPEKEKEEELDENKILFSSVDEYINYYKDNGFKLINDSQEEHSRKVALRKFSVDKHEEIKITQSDSKISVTQMLNGKKVD